MLLAPHALLYPCTQFIKISSAGIFKLLKSPKIPKNRFLQPMSPGRPVRQPYSYSVPSPHRLFLNSSTEKFWSIPQNLALRRMINCLVHRFCCLYSVYRTPERALEKSIEEGRSQCKRLTSQEVAKTTRMGLWVKSWPTVQGKSH